VPAWATRWAATVSLLRRRLAPATRETRQVGLPAAVAERYRRPGRLRNLAGYFGIGRAASPHQLLAAAGLLVQSLGWLRKMPGGPALLPGAGPREEYYRRSRGRGGHNPRWQG